MSKIIMRRAATVTANLRRLADWLDAHPGAQVARSDIGGNLLIFDVAGHYLGHADPLMGDLDVEETDNA